MKTLKKILICSMVIFAFSCSDDDDETMQPDTSLKLSELVGSWKATSSVHTNNSDSSESYDIIANGGEVRFTMLNGGKTRTWVDFGEYQDEWDAQATLIGTTLTMTPAESNRAITVFKIEKEGSRITLTNKNDRFDFSLTGSSEVSTTAVTVFVRN